MLRGANLDRRSTPDVSKLRRLSPPLRVRQILVEGKCIAIQIIEGEFARSPWSEMSPF